MRLDSTGAAQADPPQSLQPTPQRPNMLSSPLSASDTSSVVQKQQDTALQRDRDTMQGQDSKGAAAYALLTRGEEDADGGVVTADGGVITASNWAVDSAGAGVATLSSGFNALRVRRSSGGRLGPHAAPGSPSSSNSITAGWGLSTGGLESSSSSSRHVGGFGGFGGAHAGDAGQPQRMPLQKQQQPQLLATPRASAPAGAGALAMADATGSVADVAAGSTSEAQLHLDHSSVAPMPRSALDRTKAQQQLQQQQWIGFLQPDQEASADTSSLLRSTSTPDNLAGFATGAYDDQQQYNQQDQQQYGRPASPAPAQLAGAATRRVSSPAGVGDAASAAMPPAVPAAVPAAARDIATTLASQRLSLDSRMPAQSMRLDGGTSSSSHAAAAAAAAIAAAREAMWSVAAAAAPAAAAPAGSDVYPDDGWGVSSVTSVTPAGAFPPMSRAEQQAAQMQHHHGHMQGHMQGQMQQDQLQGQVQQSQLHQGQLQMQQGLLQQQLSAMLLQGRPSSSSGSSRGVKLLQNPGLSMGVSPPMPAHIPAEVAAWQQQRPSSTPPYNISNSSTSSDRMDDGAWGPRPSTAGELQLQLQNQQQQLAAGMMAGVLQGAGFLPPQAYLPQAQAYSTQAPGSSGYAPGGHTAYGSTGAGGSGGNAGGGMHRMPSPLDRPYPLRSSSPHVLAPAATSSTAGAYPSTSAVATAISSVREAMAAVEDEVQQLLRLQEATQRRCRLQAAARAAVAKAALTAAAAKDWLPSTASDASNANVASYVAPFVAANGGGVHHWQQMDMHRQVHNVAPEQQYEQHDQQEQEQQEQVLYRQEGLLGSSDSAYRYEAGNSAATSSDTSSGSQSAAAAAAMAAAMEAMGGSKAGLGRHGSFGSSSAGSAGCGIPGSRVGGREVPVDAVHKMAQLMAENTQLAEMQQLLQSLNLR